MPRTAVPTVFDLQKGLHFDGVSGIVTIPDNAAYSPSTTNYLTVSCWFNPDTDEQPGGHGSLSPNEYVDFINKAEYSAGSYKEEWQFRLYNRTNHETDNRENEISFYAFNAAGGTGVSGDAKKVPTNAGRWIHLVGQIDMTNAVITGGVVRLYRNGVMTEQAALSGHSIVPSDTTGRLTIGAGVLGEGTPSYFKGYIDDLRIWNRLLSEGEIQSLYLSNANIQSGLVGWWKLDEGSGTTAIDSSSVANNGVISGGAAYANSLVRTRTPVSDGVSKDADDYVQTRFKIRDLSKSLQLNGTSQYASITDASQVGLDFGLHDFIAGGWFRIIDNGNVQELINKYSGGTSPNSAGSTGWGLRYRGDTTKALEVSWRDGTTGATSSFTTKNLADHQWHHICVVMDRSALAYLYVDGAEIKNSSASGTTGTFTNAGKFIVGARQDGTAGFLKGFVNEVFVYDLGTNGLNPEAQARNIIYPIYFLNQYLGAGLVSRWSFDNTPNDQNAANNLTLTGSPAYSTETHIKARTLAT
jgi:Concanavalin A-like lectin/glucanases superfamily